MLNNGTNSNTEPIRALTSGAFEVYPNPSTGVLNITYNGTADREDVVFRLFDMVGNVVIEKKNLSTMRSFQLPPTANGVYTYTISSGNEILKQDKLIVER